MKDILIPFLVENEKKQDYYIKNYNSNNESKIETYISAYKFLKHVGENQPKLMLMTRGFKFYSPLDKRVHTVPNIAGTISYAPMKMRAELLINHLEFNNIVNEENYVIVVDPLLNKEKTPKYTGKKANVLFLNTKKMNGERFNHNINTFLSALYKL